MDFDADDSQAMEDLELARMDLDLSSPPIESKKKKKNKKKKDRESSVQATIQVFQEQPEKLAPLVGYFPSGFDPNGHNSDEGEPSSAMARVFRNKDKPKRLQLVVTPANGSKVDFVGTNYIGEAAAGHQHCNYALGVLDKETQTLKIVPIASNKIFRLEPKVRGLDSPNEEFESLAKGESAAQQKADKMNRLNEKFGTSKSRREANKLQVLNREHNPQYERDLDGTIKQIVVKKEDIESSQVHNVRNTPPYNAAATTPQEAYPLDKIIFEGEWDFLEDIYELLQKEAEDKWNAYPTFVSNRIHKLQKIEDEDEKKSLSGIFSYITHLVKFKDQNSMDGASSAKNHKMPRILRQKFESMFDPVSRKLSPEKHNLLISYVLVLSLYADEFRSDLSDIAKDLKISSAALREHYEHLGCKLVQAKKIWYATLPVPLKFPSLRQKRRR
ncbi:RNA polymerase I associated factor, A49-like [Trema orientale]|uniref:RNA polymerase I associated factor, A49-like n=1 Tax=Trema orientale TaxID=63057 RepID=A0A2P5FEH8_TREOI|nr:RNA polymerase I associated factor, A49-like [Trema orientale]